MGKRMAEQENRHLQQSEQALEENNSWDRLSRWETVVDEKIRAWIGDGNMADHPLAGQRLNFDDESEHTPEELRLAHKIMRDNEVVPPWMALAFTLRDKHAKILNRAEKYAKDYVKRRQDALLSGSYMRDKHARDRWHDAIKRLRRDIEAYNSELLNYNLMVPRQIGQMVPLNAEELIQQALERAENLAKQ